MNVRKLGILAATVMATMGLYAPSAEAQIVPTILFRGVAVCLVAGSVGLSVGVPVPPTSTGGGIYTAPNLFGVCANYLSGVCSFASYGSTQGDSPTSGFSGDFNSTAPCFPTGQTCSGNIGGQRLVSWTPGTPPTPTLTLGSFPNPDWSFSAGPLLTASLSDVDCTGIPGPPVLAQPNLDDGEGVFAAVAGPDPDPQKLNGPCGNPSNAPVNFCGIVIAGAAVIVWT